MSSSRNLELNMGETGLYSTLTVLLTECFAHVEIKQKEWGAKKC